MRTYAQWLSIDQKNCSAGLSTLPSYLLLKQFYWMVTGEYHSFEKPKKEEKGSRAVPYGKPDFLILGNPIVKRWNGKKVKFL
jgi:hypothetical protein